MEEKLMITKIDQSGLDNQNLIVRKKLIPIRERIISQIDSSPNGAIFTYDFSEVEGINGSGVDEIISKVVKHLLELEDKFLFIENLREDYYEHKFNIDGFLKNRSKIGIVEKSANGFDFLGDISQTQKELLCYVYENKQVTARDVADELDKKITLISTHLNTLYKKRLIQRVEESLIEGGRQFAYRSLF